jgi:hypothetical protein
MTLRKLGSQLNLYPASGADSTFTSVNKFGRNTAVASGGTEEIWDGSAAYVFPTDTSQMTHIRSAVDSATTQGAVIEVQGLDANWAAVTQTKALDGTDSTTEVELDTPLIRAFRMKVLDGSVMDQDIWLGDDDFVVAAARAIITAGENQTLMAIYTVPADKVAYLTNYYAHHNPTTGQTFTSNPIRLWAMDNANGYAPQLKHIVGVAADGAFIHEFNPYYKFTEKTDIFITSSPVSGAADISAGFDLILTND